VSNVNANSAGGVADQVLAAARHLLAHAPNPQVREQAQAVVDRLSGPLRVAIAGRVKAGKSTLLNALVGERLAPTDAGECTKIISRYSRGAGYEVVARLVDGRSEPLAFNRTGGSLDVKLGGLREADIATLDVSWPTSTLETITLIDTPGLASINDENSRRTREFLEFDEGKPSDADAVIYLMRHAHRSDVAFLDAFMDRSVTAASPVNAVAVLSRADEIGAGRLDAMESAGRIAQRYSVDPSLTGLCAAVVPLAGLLAETGLTLREDEVASLRLLAATPDEVLDRMLLSVDQFCATSASELTVELRRNLLDRLGVFGVRLAIARSAPGAPPRPRRSGPSSSSSRASTGCAAHHSPLHATCPHPAGPLRAGLAAVAVASARSVRAAVAADLDRQLEQIEASTVQFAQVRGAHLVGSGAVVVPSADRAELDRLFAHTEPLAALGLSGGATKEQVQQAALAGIGKWRTLAGDPLADPSSIEVFDTAARVLESVYGVTLR
jgi:hypothetical protein